jgi:hypothetical protein
MAISIKSALELIQKKVQKLHHYTDNNLDKRLKLLQEICCCLSTMEQELTEAGLADKEFEIPEVFTQAFQKPDLSMVELPEVP